jgi:hypothetical protein
LPGAYILTINAIDPDQSSNSDNIVYYLDEQKRKNNDWKSFDLDSKSGVLTLNTELDIKKQSVYLVRVNLFYFSVKVFYFYLLNKKKD